MAPTPVYYLDPTAWPITLAFGWVLGYDELSVTITHGRRYLRVYETNSPGANFSWLVVSRTVPHRGAEIRYEESVTCIESQITKTGSNQARAR